MSKRAQNVALAGCLAVVILLAGISSAQAAPPEPLPIKLPSPALVSGFNQIAASQPGGMPAAVHAAVYFAEHQAWAPQRLCIKMSHGCFPSITAQWGQYRVRGYDNPHRFRDGGFALEFMFKSNQDRGYGKLREQLYFMFSGGSFPGELPNRAIQYRSIDDAVDWTIKYYKFLNPRIKRVKVQKQPRQRAVATARANVNHDLRRIP